MYKALRFAEALGVVALAWACDETPTAPTERASADVARGGAGRPVVVVNPHASANAAVANTIQDGVELVADGGRVLILPGTYAESVVVTKGVTLERIGSGDVVLAPSSSLNALTVSTSAPVVIRGLTIINRVFGRGVFGRGRVDLTIEDVAVHGPDRGAEVNNSARITGGRARLEVRNSTFDGGSPATMSVAVFVVTDVNGMILGNTVRRTRFACIQVQGSASGDVIGNDVDDCGPFGGIRAIMGGPFPVVNMIRNRIRNSSPSASLNGITFVAGTGRIERNSVVNYVQPTAPVGGFRAPAGILVAAIAAPVVRFNDIAGNAHAGLRSSLASTLDATCNWWGSSTGPSGSGTGNGDAVFGSVVFVPFATVPIAGTSATDC